MKCEIKDIVITTVSVHILGGVRIIYIPGSAATPGRSTWSSSTSSLGSTTSAVATGSFNVDLPKVRR